MKIVFSIIFLISISFAYEKGQIDTHGGKTDSLNSGSFSNSLSLGSSLKESNTIKTENIEKIEPIIIEKKEDIKKEKKENE